MKLLLSSIVVIPSLIYGLNLSEAVQQTIQTNPQVKVKQAELETEKTEIKSELDALVVKYDAKIAENTALNTKLSAARQDIILYRDSLNAEKKASYATIKRYKSRVYSLTKKNKELFRQVEELTSQNKKLIKLLLVRERSFD